MGARVYVTRDKAQNLYAMHGFYKKVKEGFWIKVGLDMFIPKVYIPETSNFEYRL